MSDVIETPKQAVSAKKPAVAKKAVPPKEKGGVVAKKAVVKRAPKKAVVAAKKPSGGLSQSLYATGKRKNAIARVYLNPGKGDIKVNDKALEEYFPTVRYGGYVQEPLHRTKLLGRYDVVVRVHGGGVSAQAQAARHGVAKILAELDGQLHRQVLKQAGLLTRDSRVKERKKYGQPGARKKFQFSKR